MAEVKIKGVKELEESLVSYLEKFVDDPDTKKIVGEKAKKYIVASLRTGNEEYKQPDVSQAWANRRKVLARSNDLSQFSPSGQRSKLTFTGEFLESLTYEPIRGGIKLSFKGEHKPYRGEHGKSGKAVSNEAIAEGLAANGRRFLFISAKLRTQLESEIARELRRKLSLYQKLSRKVNSEAK